MNGSTTFETSGESPGLQPVRELLRGLPPSPILCVSALTLIPAVTSRPVQSELIRFIAFLVVLCLVIAILLIDTKRRTLPPRRRLFAALQLFRLRQQCFQAFEQNSRIAEASQPLTSQVLRLLSQPASPIRWSVSTVRRDIYAAMLLVLRDALSSGEWNPEDPLVQQLEGLTVVYAARDGARSSRDNGPFLLGQADTHVRTIRAMLRTVKV